MRYSFVIVTQQFNMTSTQARTPSTNPPNPPTCDPTAVSSASFSRNGLVWANHFYCASSTRASLRYCHVEASPRCRTKQERSRVPSGMHRSRRKFPGFHETCQGRNARVFAFAVQYRRRHSTERVCDAAAPAEQI